MHLQKVVAGAGDGQLEDVQPDIPAAACGDRQGVQQTGRRQVICLQLRTYSSTAAGWPGHHTERRVRASVLSRPKCRPGGVARSSCGGTCARSARAAVKTVKLLLVPDSDRLGCPRNICTLHDANLRCHELSTGANGQKEDAASFFCPRSFDRAVTATMTITRVMSESRATLGHD